MAVTEFTFKQTMDLISTPKVILEGDGKTVCASKQIDCIPMKILHYVHMMKNSCFHGQSTEVPKN